MTPFFKSVNKISLFYFLAIGLDVYVKLYLPIVPYRYISKAIMLSLITLLYCFNNNEQSKRNKTFVIIALMFFIFGDAFVLWHQNFIFLAISLVFFSFAKLFLSFRLSHKYDFNIGSLIPISIAMFIYTVVIFNLIYSNLNNFLIPAIGTFFVSLLLFQFSALRQGVVNTFSYFSVLLGVLFYIISESMMAVKIFNGPFLYQEPLIIIFYSLSHYLIIIGLIRERVIKKDISTLL